MGAPSTVPADGPTRLIVLGSTGSIGVQTLEVVRALNATRGGPRFEVVGLAAKSNGDLLRQQAQEFGVTAVALAERDGPDAALRMVEQTGCTLVVSAMVGAAGLAPTLAAMRRGAHIAIANKEALVAAGHLLTGGPSHLLPIDSEHSAIWQCLQAVPLPLSAPVGLARVVLTASGGPFRTQSAADAFNSTPEQALKHPRWKMGPKITIDSATMVNKAFEMIEARWLFNLRSDQIEVAVHPQSVVHSLVEFDDGAFLAQLGSPDMKGPIGYALQAVRSPGDSNRHPAGARRLSFKEAMNLEFTPACEQRWEALALARRVIDGSFTTPGSALGAVFNAANEVAVEAFLAGSLPFGRITGLCREVMDAMTNARAATLDGVLAIDAQARALACARAGSHVGGAR
ncbi:MAG: 1-deoxy-D-xylulose-5-phosphate reductoisomerase [Phycisphaerales bacterium]|nr:1-deoxy-D-xylulose-5-phosphate reductoisomerase [Phycisphaerales bacterium]